MNKNRKRPQAQKPRYIPTANTAMHEAMVELRQGSRTQPHRLKNREERQDFRKQRQRGEWS